MKVARKQRTSFLIVKLIFRFKAGEFLNTRSDELVTVVTDNCLFRKNIEESRLVLVLRLVVIKSALNRLNSLWQIKTTCHSLHALVGEKIEEIKKNGNKSTKARNLKMELAHSLKSPLLTS